MKPWIILLLILVGLLGVSVAINRRSQVSALAVAGEAMPVTRNDGQRVSVLVELFTSEGCSSCPPADAVLARLESAQPVPGAEIIALGQHVDYWNYIGWRDPFSSHQFSERQQAYAQAFAHDGIYTPQMVVDGETEFVGSNLNKAREAIARAAMHPKAAIELTRPASAAKDSEPQTSLHVRVTDLPPLSSTETIDLWLAITESNLSSQVARGENAGRKLAHGSVVRLLGRVAEAEAKEADTLTAAPEIKLQPEWKRENLRAVVFVQARQSRRILGAAALSLSGG